MEINTFSKSFDVQLRVSVYELMIHSNAIENVVGYKCDCEFVVI